MIDENVFGGIVFRFKGRDNFVVFFFNEKD